MANVQRVRIIHACTLMLVCGFASARDGNWDSYRATKQEKAALENISANSLNANLAFLASDLLEGRGTPSRGLDIAADYIAAQFQLAGLTPAGGAGFFQVTPWVPRRGPAPEGQPVNVRNVVGVLKGSDPILSDTYILVTAHYDHLGIKTEGDDRISNGANDNASGVVTVIELAKSLATLKARPKRSIVFMTFYGEEGGLVGARYYSEHPIFPVERTVANINIEQVGRTDDSDNPGPNLASVTGMDFSDVGAILAAAGRKQGVRVFKHERNSDAYFSASDNLPLAQIGIPAHTFSSAYAFPDYHKVSDHIDKIDFENMARLNRVLALGVLMIANNKKEPEWDTANPKTEKYAKARKP